MAKYLTLLASISLVAATCPPTDLRPVDGFNLDRLLQHPWYVQEQMTVIYQKEEDLFCVKDTYYMDGKDTMYLRTDWNKGAVDGPRTDQTMHGIIEDVNNPSHLLVGFKYMPRFIRGPYWVVAYGETSSGEYDWMIVSGGPPKNESKNGKCKTGTFFNYSGLWLFTREQIVSPDLIQHMRDVLETKGYDTSILIKVQQEGCK